MPGGPTMIAWLDADQVELVRAIAGRLDGELVGVGSPDARKASELAQDLCTIALDDLRNALASESCDLFVHASAGGLAADHSPADLQALLDARSRGLRVVTLAPLPASAMGLQNAGWLQARQGVTPAECVRFVPLARSGVGFVAMRERLDDFGRISAMSIEMLSRPGDGSLGGHLFAAAQLALSLLRSVESVDAAYHPPGPAGVLRPLPGDSLADLHGGLTAHMRTGDARGITLIASDQAACWSRDLTIVGEGGQMRVSDDTMEWVGPDGSIMDSSLDPGREVPTLQDAGQRAISDAISAVLRDHPSESQPVDLAGVLALGQAALLSARTGQNESPETIQRMVRVG